MRSEKLVFLALLMIPMGVLITLSDQGERWRRVQAAWDVESFRSVEGQITQQQTRGPQRAGQGSQEHVAFSYRVGDRTLQGDNWMTRASDTASSVRAKTGAGGQITVYYDPDEPEVATLSRDVPFWTELGKLFIGPFMVILGSMVALPWLLQRWQMRNIERERAARQARREQAEREAP